MLSEYRLHQKRHRKGLYRRRIVGQRKKTGGFIGLFDRLMGR